MQDIVSLLGIGISKGKSAPHALDILGRKKTIKDMLNVNRLLTISDTQIERLFSNYLEIPYNLPVMLYKFLKPFIPKSNIPSSMVLDGTSQGGKLHSVAALVDHFPFFVGIEPIEKRGKELEASRRLANRVLKGTRQDFTFYTTDGLYFVYSDFQKVREKDPSKHLFVKTKEATLDIVQTTETEYLIDKERKSKDRSRLVKGFDEERICSFEIFRASPFQHKEVKSPLFCYRVEEHYPKNGRQEIFYCVTTAPDLKLTEAREIAKKRWQIENNIFRIGNQSIHTKHRYFINDIANTRYLTLLYALLDRKSRVVFSG